MRPTATYLLLLCLCFGPSLQLASQKLTAKYRFQHFDAKDGLGSDYTLSVAQDDLGFIWIQSRYNLTRYDGYDFRVYRHDPNETHTSLPNSELSWIYTSPTGELWITPNAPGQDYVLTRYDRKTDGFVQYHLNLQGVSSRKIRFDRTGKILWFTTPKGLFQFDPETHLLNNYVNVQEGGSANDNIIHDVSDEDSVLLVGSANGLWIFDKHKKHFYRANAATKDSAFFNSMPIIGIYEWRNRSASPDNDKEIWLLFERDSTSELGLVKVDKNFTILQRFDFPGTLYGVRLMSLDRDREGVFWIATWGIGMCRYDPRDNSYVNIRKIPSDPQALRSDFVMGVMVDTDQNIWAATNRGLSKLQNQSLTFYNTKKPGHILRLSTLLKARKKDYLLIDNAKAYGDHEIMVAPIVPGDLDSLIFSPVISSFRGPQLNGFWRGMKKFWISVSGVGLIHSPIDPETEMIKDGPLTTLSHDPNNDNTISSNIPTCVWEDADENLWVGIRNQGLNKISSKIPYGTTGSVEKYQHVPSDTNSLSSNDVVNIYPEHENSFWVLTAAGVDLFANNRFIHHFKNKERATSLHKTAEGTVLIGTTRGLYKGIKKRNNSYIFQKLKSIKDIHVVTINEDPIGRFWISTLQGIICYDPKSNLTIEFNRNDGFEYYRTSDPNCMPYITSNGLMVIPGYDGYSLFDPLSLRVNQHKTLSVFTKLLINNKPHAIKHESHPKSNPSVDRDISVLRKLTLDHNHNNFTLEYSAMEFTSPEKNLYRHKLEGYDKEWIETDWKSRTATYTNLDPGTYTFKVKASNHHGIWSDHETTLSVVILPPPWLTWWAYTLYTLAVASVFLYWRNYELKRIRLKNRARQLTELDHLKTRFFANISHEFRTPITLILGPLRDLYNNAVKEDEKALLAVMIRNGQRLLRLINQLLDLSKIEAGKMQLRVARIEMVAFLRDHASAYESIAASKNLRYNFNPGVERLDLYADREKMEKVIHNLLSNAFKFTAEGHVTIAINQIDNNRAEITVEDSGTGIPEDQLDKVFDRFYQVDNSQTRAHEGSGLGLALTKEIVELHHGTISVKSRYARGTTFTLTLPTSKEVFERSGIIEHDDREGENIFEMQPLPDALTPSPVTNRKPLFAEDQPLLLIVEDNADMRTYIRNVLSGHYKIREAVNGKEGLESARQEIPDLIITDIMMPEMDGYKFCGLIKSNELTSHIPVILLTAKADRDSKITGLETGADDYLAKPFDREELELIIRNRIEERRKMRERFSKEITLGPKHIAVTSLDEKFLSKVLAIIETHMEDARFSIVELSAEAGYSHIQFYRKLKALTGQTPNHFMRTIRLKRAAALLRNNSDHVAQVAYAVGFGSESYFIKCFKEQYGMTPGEFSQKNEGEVFSS